MRLNGSGLGLLLKGDGLSADRAELCIRSESGAALSAGDDGRLRLHRATAVGAEVGAPNEWGATLAPRGRRCSPYGDRRREQRVQLLQTLVERDQLIAAIDEQVLPELIAPEHLQHQAAEIPQTLLAHA